MNLKEIRKEYAFGNYMLSATGNIKAPIRIGTIYFAQHEDRSNQIANLKQHCLDVYREMHPATPKDKFEKLKYALEHDFDFISAVKEQIERMNYLLSLEKDIINSEGGVIYCGETNTFAKKI